MIKHEGSKLRTALRGLRPALNITQKRVASLSQGLPAPISREFVANLEANGLPGTVRKFLSFAWLTHADLRLLTELSVIDAPENPEDLAPGEVIAQCRELSSSGQHQQALALVLPAIHTRSLPAEAEVLGRLLVAAALAANRGGFWHLGRDLAEQAICCKGLSPVNHSRAALVAAQCLNALDREELALHYLELVDQRLFEADPHLAASYWHDLTVFYRSIGRHDEALAASAKAIELYRDLDLAGVQGVLLSVRALLLSQTREPAHAVPVAREAIALSESSSDRGSAARRVYLNAGRVFLSVRELWSARRSLLKSRELAECAGHDLHLFETNLYFCELAQLEESAAESSRLRRVLTLDAPRFQLDRLLSAECERILQ